MTDYEYHVSLAKAHESLERVAQAAANEIDQCERRLIAIRKVIRHYRERIVRANRVIENNGMPKYRREQAASNVKLYESFVAMLERVLE